MAKITLSKQTFRSSEHEIPQRGTDLIERDTSVVETVRHHAGVALGDNTTLRVPCGGDAR
jgi:hypothetical protein